MPEAVTALNSSTMWVTLVLFLLMPLRFGFLSLAVKTPKSSKYLVGIQQMNECVNKCNDANIYYLLCGRYYFKAQ